MLGYLRFGSRIGLFICPVVAFTVISGALAGVREEIIRVEEARLRIQVPQYTEASAQAKPTDAKISLSLSPAAGNGSVTVGEPLLVKAVMRNDSAGGVRINCGSSSHPPALIQVKDAKGNVLAATPMPKFHTGEGISGIMSLDPDRSETYYFVPTGLYRFAKPGDYTLSMRIYLDLDTFVPAEMRVRVAAYNRKVLEERCEEFYGWLSAPFREKWQLQDLAVNAICSVQDDAALPYLDLMARELPYKEPFVAIRRLDTPRARKLIACLSARTDEVGKLARESEKALSQPADVMHDISWK